MENLPGLEAAVSKTVRSLRNNLKLSQAQFAALTGLSRIYIAQLETGGRGASLNVLLLIARSVEV